MATSAKTRRPRERPGLRERKRAQTEQAIVDSAMKLFARHGFAATTADDIAVAAGISRRTLFRYFPTKEDIVLDPRRLDQEFARDALRERRAGEDEIAHVMRVLAELQRRAFAVIRPEHQLVLHRLSHGELAGRSLHLMDRARKLIADCLVSRRASRSERLRARLLASACIVAVDACATAWVEGGAKGDLAPLLDEAAEHLRRGFAQKPTV